MVGLKSTQIWSDFVLSGYLRECPHEERVWSSIDHQASWRPEVIRVNEGELFEILWEAPGVLVLRNLKSYDPRQRVLVEFIIRHTLIKEFRQSPKSQSASPTKSQRQ